MKHAGFRRSLWRRMIRSTTLGSGKVCSGISLAFLCVSIVVVTLFGQSREAYQQAYRDWRASDPSLERDAAKAGAALTPRSEKAAAAASKFILARKAFYNAQRDDLAEMLKTMQPFELPKEIESAKSADAYLAIQDASVANSIEVFGADPDKGIQQLRQALEKERQALMALRSAIKTRENAAEAANQANESADRARMVAVDQTNAIAASFAQSGQDIGRLAEAWPTYYRSLAEGARGTGTADTTPAPAIRPSNSTPPAAQAAPATSGRVPAGVLISRYTGSWTFLPGVSTYHGMPPISCDVTVREEGGQIVGKLDASFIVAGKVDPNIRFDFSGPLQAGRYQAFALKTAEGVQGKVELIPGNAFNLLEVNYVLDGAPGKVREADVILVKR